MAAQSAIYCTTNPDFTTKPRMIDIVGLPENELKSIEDFIQTDPLAGKLPTHFRPVIASDVDLPRELPHRATEAYLEKHPEIREQGFHFHTRVRTGIVTMDLPVPTIGLGVHRWTPHDEPFTFRDVRLMELVRPHLLQTIKNILLREKLTQFKSLAQKLLEDSPAPQALVERKGWVLIQNPGFEELFSLQPRQRLPADLTDLLQREMDSLEPPFDVKHPKTYIPFYTLPQGTFRLTLTPVKEEPGEPAGQCLLRFESAHEPFSQMNLLMQQAGLSEREMEVCALIGDGIQVPQIASRLFLGLHTVGNHVKSIHKKFGVNTRGKLVAPLRQG